MTELFGALSGLVLFVIIVFCLWLMLMWIVLPIYIMRIKGALDKMVRLQVKFNKHYKIE